MKVNMNQKQQSIFKLYYENYTVFEIAEILDTTYEAVKQTITRFGDEWVKNHLPEVHKLRLLELSRIGLTSTEIAEEFKWNRWIVTWTLRHLNVQELFSPTYDVIPKSRILDFRCPICISIFSSSLIDLITNPDRICPTCVDRRVTDRRILKRDKNAYDVTEQSGGGTFI